MIAPLQRFGRRMRLRLTRRDEGRAIVEFIFVGVLLLVPLIYLVIAIARVQAAAFSVSTAAREAGRALHHRSAGGRRLSPRPGRRGDLLRGLRFRARRRPGHQLRRRALPAPGRPGQCPGDDRRPAATRAGLPGRGRPDLGPRERDPRRVGRPVRGAMKVARSPLPSVHQLRATPPRTRHFRAPRPGAQGSTPGHPLGRLRRPGPRRRDRGQISILILGLFGIVVVLIIGGIDVTAAQIARTRLLDAADAAALDAADALDEPGAYGNGIGSSVTVSSATVQEAAASNLASRPRPSGITSWTTTAGTGTTDGQTAVVVVQGVADLPLTGGLLSSLGGSVTITVQARARAPLS